MNVLAVIWPGLKVLFERVGKPEIVNRPNLFRSGGAGAVIACNHVGWADSLWMAYAVYPRQLRYMSKEELFNSTLSRWVLTHGGSLPIDRADPSPSSIKTAVDMLQHGEIILIFPSGTRSEEKHFTPGFHLCPPSFKARSRCKSRISCTDLPSG